jgi:hypothetical protein
MPDATRASAEPSARPSLAGELAAYADDRLAERLAAAAARYLAAVDYYRREGCAPTWRAEREDVAWRR